VAENTPRSNSVVPLRLHRGDDSDLTPTGSWLRHQSSRRLSITPIRWQTLSAVAAGCLASAAITRTPARWAICKAGRFGLAKFPAAMLLSGLGQYLGRQSVLLMTAKTHALAWFSNGTALPENLWELADNSTRHRWSVYILLPAKNSKTKHVYRLVKLRADAGRERGWRSLHDFVRQRTLRHTLEDVVNHRLGFSLRRLSRSKRPINRIGQCGPPKNTR
jgi:hypothetical protein